MIVIAVTGGVACGKSTAALKLREALPSGRVRSFDADFAVKQLMEEQAVFEAIQKIDGKSLEHLANGEIDKEKLRKRVFDNSEYRERLENVLHPLVLDQASQFCDHSRSVADVVLMEIPLLYEVEFPLARDLDLVVAASGKTQRTRLQNERQLDRELADSIIASQLPVEEKIDRGDIVVWNDGSREVLDNQIQNIAARCLPFLN
ncbi:MAG: dephospho-CoA kinase [Verrucomicrobiota bacterium]|nr:dephospho-CoA kinase [Verrucomicrobiota bacterium]